MARYKPVVRRGSPKLEAFASEIEARLGYRASVMESSWQSHRKSGRLITRSGPVRYGYLLYVTDNDGRRVTDWNTADYMTRLVDIRRWIDTEVAKRARAPKGKR